MKYLLQFTIILGISFVGEALNRLIPLPVPASIYGLIIMLLLLCFKVLKLSHVKETGEFLLVIMPIMFIPPAAGIIDRWSLIKTILIPSIIILVFVTIVIMVVTGKVTQAIITLRERGEKNAD